MFSLSFVDGTCYIYVILYLFTYTGVKHDFNIIYMMFVSFNSNMRDATRGAETAYPSRVHGFTSSVLCDSCCSILSFHSVLYIILCLFSFGHSIVCLFSFSHSIVCLFSFGHSIVCLFSFSHSIVCLFSFSHSIVCLFSFGHSIGCLFSFGHSILSFFFWS